MEDNDMKMTSAEANKLLRALYDEHKNLLHNERETATFVAATVENLEDARPEYKYTFVQARLKELEDKIRTVKHAINVFNISQEVPGSGMTIDQILIYIPQMTERKRKLADMRSKAKKQRVTDYRSNNLIEYSYANYDVSKASDDYQAVTDELAKVQNALDLVNSTVQFDVNI